MPISLLWLISRPVFAPAKLSYPDANRLDGLATMPFLMPESGGRTLTCHATIDRFQPSAMVRHNLYDVREGSTAVAFHPPLAPAKAFSRSGCGKNFSLFSRVMQEKLSTFLGGSKPGSALSGAFLS